MKPTSVVYEGPEDGLCLAPVHGDLWFPRGVPVEVSAELGRSLCEQPHFSLAKRRRTESPGDPLAGTEIPETTDPNVETR